MISLKRIGGILSFLLMIFIAVMVLVNIQLNYTYRKIDRITVLEENLSSGVEDINLPIRVLVNISEQLVGDDVEKAIRLEEAKDNSVDQLRASLESNRQDIIEMTETLKAFRGLMVNHQMMTLMHSSLNELMLLQETLAENLDLIEKNTSLDNSDVLIDMEEIYGDLLLQHDLLKNTYYDFETYTRNLSINVINGGLLFLLILVVLLLVLVMRLIRIDLKTLSETYHQIDSHNFDYTKVAIKHPRFEEEKIMNNTSKSFFSNQQQISAFNSLVSKQYMIDDIIDHLLLATNKLFDVERVGISFYDKEAGVLTTEYGVATYESIFLKVGYKSDIKNSSLALVISEKKGNINNDVLKSFENHPESKSLTMIIKEGIRSNMSVPLIINNEVFGVVFFSSKKVNHFTKENHELASKLIYEITGALNRSYLMKFFMNRITNSFARLVDKKDIETGDHLLRMVKYSKIIAEGLNEMNLATHPADERFVIDIERNAAIHDIGKVGTPDYILKKPGKLTEEEFEIMKTHAVIGGGIFKELNKELSSFSEHFYNTAEMIATYHHEKWNGKGYPEGLSGTEIPLCARVVALADVFDALTSKRIYKEAFPFEKALSIVMESSGEHFDPIVVRAFENKLLDIRQVYETHH